MKTFKTHVQVLSQHVDSTGIVHFPRYLEMAHAVIEQWFDDALDHGFAQFQGSDNAAVPVGRADMRFPAPSRLGDQLVWRLQVREIGRSSMELGLTASCGGDVRAEITIGLVLSDLGVMRPRQWPKELVARAEEYRLERAQA
jgi:4-hydroxybenzoyl-CoA thioesterase